ncbi:hypothetical protein PFLUV_G00137930 [Perca fluviatilis]|uniref:Uncharacterized protein n=1 Tax=Perca fluviatilis TaxID=8168 RepID=A0A6A5F4T5_PERFL|nr:hypothetical protein PFLUV_G00137930 [Perca fluviatilis]
MRLHMRRSPFPRSCNLPAAGLFFLLSGRVLFFAGGWLEEFSCLLAGFEHGLDSSTQRDMRRVTGATLSGSSSVFLKTFVA